MNVQEKRGPREAAVLSERTSRLYASLVGAFIFSVLVFGFLTFKATLTDTPLVIGDEYYYRSQAIHAESLDKQMARVPQQVMPNLFYMRAVGGLDSADGRGYIVAKIFNVICYMLTSVFIFLVGRRITKSDNLALICSVIALFFPDSQYTTYYTPESFYRLGFWVILYLVIGTQSSFSYVRSLFLGAVAALVYYIKPHALFLLLAICSTEAWLIVRTKGLQLRELVATVIPTIAGFGVLLALIGALSRASAGAGALGGYYDQILHFFSDSPSNFWELLSLIAQTIGWHICALIFVGGILVVELVRLGVTVANTDSDDFARKRFYVFILVFLVSIIAVTGKITLDQQAFGRINMRYYNFVFPALLMIAFDPKRVSYTFAYRAGLGLLWLAIIAFMLFTAKSLAPLGVPWIADAPELSLLEAPIALKIFICAVVALAVLSYILDAPYRTVAALCALVFVVIASQIVSVRLTSELNGLLPYRRSAEFMLSLAGRQPASLDRGIIVGPAPGFVYSVLFHAAGVPWMVVRPIGSEVHFAEFPNADWIYCIGGCRFDGEFESYVKSPYGEFARRRQ
jgi:hypothetical protein